MKISICKKLSSFVVIVITYFSCNEDNIVNSFGVSKEVKLCVESLYFPIKDGKKFKKGNYLDLPIQKFIFDTLGNPTNIYKMDSLDTILEKMNIEYKNGRSTGNMEFDCQGNLLRRTIIEKDSKRIIKSKIYNKNDTLITEDTQYLRRGKCFKLVRESFIKEHVVPLAIINYTFNSKDLIETTHILDRKGNIYFSSKYVYTKFDQYGNWLEKIIYKDNNFKVPYAISTREYLYHQMK